MFILDGTRERSTTPIEDVKCTGRTLRLVVAKKSGMLRLLRAEAGSMISIILPMVFHGKELIYKLEITRNPSNYRSCRNSGFAGLFFVVFSS